jgi:hypothetical protein
MSAESVSLLLAVGALVGLVLILVLPEGWMRLLARRSRRRGGRARNRVALPPREQRLTCADCGSISPPGSPRWKAYLTIDRETVILCPDCADPQPHVRRLPRWDESE